MDFFVLFIIFVLGLCFGSFVNMLVYRTAVRYEIFNSKFEILKNKEKRSFCDYCGKQLNWYENIPVFSWLIQKGKTSCCHKKLPVSYPVVEIITGLLFLIFNLKFEIFNQFLNFQTLFQFLIGLIVIVLLIFSAVFDWKYMILPDFSTGILVSSALVLWFSRYFGEWNYLLSALVASGFLLILNLITKGEGMGMGDVKLAVFMGLFLGYPNIIVAFYVAFIFGAIVGIILMIFKKAKKKSQIPFGPFLILGTLVAWIFGNNIINLVFKTYPFPLP